MTKTICDICGKDMPLEICSGTPKDYKFCISCYGKVMDVCTECRNELDKWMKERQMEAIRNSQRSQGLVNNLAKGK